MWSLRAAAVVAAVGTRSLEPRRLGASRCRGVEAALASGPFCSRALHVSAARCGSRNLLKKFLSKKKKKFWYDSPSLDSQMLYKPSSLTSIVKTAASPKPKKEDSLRKRTLDVLLYKAVTDMLNTCEVSQEAYDLRVELTKASVSSDFSVCCVYWMSTESEEQEDYIKSILQKSAPRIRHLLITRQVLGNVPPIVFVRDKADTIEREIDRLLAIADFGPLEENSKLDQSDLSRSEASDTSASSIQSNLFGIDHEVLNKQIMEYKKTKVKEVEGIGLLEQQQEQLAEIRKQMKMRKKKTKEYFDNDITPQRYLLDKYDYLDADVSSQENELEYELQEMTSEVEVAVEEDGK